MEDTRDSFDEIIGKKLLRFEEHPPSTAWTNIQKNITPNVLGSAAWKNIFFLSATFALLTAVGLFLFFGKNQEDHQPEASQRSEEIKNIPTVTTEVPGKSTFTPSEEKVNNPNNQPIGNMDAFNKPQGELHVGSPAVNSSLSSAPETRVEKKSEHAAAENISDHSPEPSAAATTPADTLHHPAAHHHAIDSIKKHPKPKSFLESKLKDTTTRLRKNTELFKKSR